MTKYCEDFPEYTCCDSCHADQEEGVFSLLEEILIDGTEAVVCCRIATKLKDDNRLC